MSASSRFAVATHVLTLLALENKNEPTTSEYLARSAGTNPVVVRRILSLMGKGGLVVAFPGSGGGVKLARPPLGITLRDVYRAVEQPQHLFSLGRRKKNLHCICSRNIEPIIEDVFQKAETAIADSFAGITISDIAQQVMEAENG